MLPISKKRKWKEGWSRKCSLKKGGSALKREKKRTLGGPRVKFERRVNAVQNRRKNHNTGIAPLFELGT